ncbi:MAG: 50S ribosomal protein L19, partial [Schleiferiaceae bacterium]|nr:50S ribosomal protein L19 [Schleiferiaceae bacterium]
MDLISHVQDSFIDKKEFPDFQAGDQITVYY